MPASSLAMSGLHTLSANQAAVLQALRLEVPPVMTTDQLKDLLTKAEAANRANFHPVLSRCTMDVLTGIKTEHLSANSAFVS
jgi:hypothetical protein